MSWISWFSMKRKNIRLKEYDYSQNGAYFVTVCTQKRRNILSRINVGEGVHPLPVIELSEIGKEIENTINFINENYNNVRYCCVYVLRLVSNINYD